jgi:hypothetical protein
MGDNPWPNRRFIPASMRAYCCSMVRRSSAVPMNLEPSAVARTAREVILGPATEVVPKWVGTLLSGHSR